MKIVVLAGGLSTERDVSINSASKVCKALREKGHQAVILDIFLGHGKTGDSLEGIFEGDPQLTQMSDTIRSVDPDLEAVKAMRTENPDCLFGPNVIEICRMADIVYMGLHGAEGENGKVQAAFDVLGIKYTGSGYLGSAMAMDKGVAKKMFQAAGIPTPKGFTVKKGEQDSVKRVVSELGFPCVVKPCCGGSSVGVSFAEDEAQYQDALELAFRYENEVVVEECIHGREFSAGVVAGEALPIIEIIPKTGFYDYKNKYQAGLTEEICPAPISAEDTERVQRLAERVYEALHLDAYGRVDFLMDKADGELYCLEANTLPGMTPTSLIPQMAAAEGMDYGELCEKIIEVSLKKYKK